MASLTQTGRWKNRHDSNASRRRPHRDSIRMSWGRVTVAAGVAALLLGVQTLAEDLRFEAIKLPALRINGQAARAHTQGLEVVGGSYYVTARRDDVLPKQALLLRTAAGRTDWDVWDVTPAAAGEAGTTLDHPGGFQSDGNRLWIPLAESKRKGRSVIRVFPLTGLVPGQPPRAECEIPVNDHIGAVAVSVGQGFVLGANWDTEAVYVWDLRGRWQRTLDGSELESRGLGAVRDSGRRAGLAVQDWKMIGGRLFASGLRRVPGAMAASSEGQLLSWVGFLEPGFQGRAVVLPKPGEVELAREGMAVSDGLISYLPEDLGASNQVLRAAIADLMKSGTSYPSGASSRP